MACYQSKSSEVTDIESLIDLDKTKPLFLDKPELLVEIVKEYINSDIDTTNKLNKFILNMRRKFNISFGNVQLLYGYRLAIRNKIIEDKPKLRQLLKSKICREHSGIASITVMTSAYPKTGEKIEKFSCKYDCHYCPNPPDMPRSYIPEEPAVARAIRNKFNCISQMRERITALIGNNIEVTKLEILVLGGTWSSYSIEYRDEFIRDIFYSVNTYFDKEPIRQPLTIKEEQHINETSVCRIIGLTIETRPDQINKKELKMLRYYGVTRVQLGIQHIDDEILRKVNRQCYTEDTIRAVKLLKDCCFKVDGHFMPDLPGSNPEKDYKMFEYIFKSPYIQVDQIKIYPTTITPYTKIKEWYDKDEFIPYAEQIIEVEINGKKQKSTPLFELLINVQNIVPYWIRINRIIRDIPNSWINGGNNVTNLRQLLDTEMQKRNIICKCIRCREIKRKNVDTNLAQLFIEKYESSEGTEYYLSYETSDRRTLFGFLRLRLSQNAGADIFDELEYRALIREIHVYGNTARPDVEYSKGNAQHMGFGKKLIIEAENIAKKEGFAGIAVISGIGVRNYYRKLGFIDGEYYLVKDLI